MQGAGKSYEGEKLCFDYNYNLNKIKEMFVYPQNIDFLIREIQIKAIKRKAALLFLHGMVEDETIQRHIITPLIENNIDCSEGELGTVVMERLITGKGVRLAYYFEEIADRIVNGETVIIIQDYDAAVSVASTGYDYRAVSTPQIENTVKGPKEAFTESEKASRSLIRKHLRYEKLVCESMMIGNKSANELFIMYVQDIVDNDLLKKVKDRLNEINVDIIDSVSILEQYVEDRPYSVVPTTLVTERPDRAVASLREGHIVLFMDGSGGAMILPVTFWTLFHTAEDMYQRWLYGNFVRCVRFLAFFAALLTPGLYIAITNYHVDMIPTDLVLAIAATRERLPFPVLVEVLLMEISFELLREGGIRIPTNVGPTIGIVGALILGQAAVEANVVSPILVIIVAITGLSSFAIPEPSLSYFVRICRFIFLFSAMIMGFFGFSACFVLGLAYVSSIKSFGVPFLSPVAPHSRSSKDTVIRPPVWKMWLRPQNIHPKEESRGGKK